MLLSERLLMEKRAIAWMIPLVGGSLVIDYYFKNRGLKDQQQLASEFSSELKKLHDENAQLKTTVQNKMDPNSLKSDDKIMVGMGLAGGGLGAYLGPKVFTNLDEEPARLLGGITGGLGGAIVGNMMKGQKQ